LTYDSESHETHAEQTEGGGFGSGVVANGVENGYFRAGAAASVVVGDVDTG
jgi:hypothetical protein